MTGHELAQAVVQERHQEPQTGLYDQREQRHGVPRTRMIEVDL